jgi:hypothetical protein
VERLEQKENLAFTFLFLQHKLQSSGALKCTMQMAMVLMAVSFITGSLKMQ